MKQIGIVVFYSEGQKVSGISQIIFRLKLNFIAKSLYLSPAIRISKIYSINFGV